MSSERFGPDVFRSARRTARAAVAWTSIACGVGLGQAGDHAGEEQPPLPEDLVIPPAPVLTPAEQLDTFSLPEGFAIELVASDPLVRDPVAVAIDAHRRFWVVEMSGYMPNIDGTGEDAESGTIAVLTDTDGDGQLDERTEFMSDLVLPRAVAPLYGAEHSSALVIAPPDLLYCEDTDGDGRADVREVVDTGFSVALANPEHAINAPLHTIDNWFQFSNHNRRYRYRDGVWETEPCTGGGQWGLTQDARGRLFFNTNSDPLRGDVVPSRYLVRNPHHGRAWGANERIAKDMKVWPARVTPGINRGYQKHMLRDGKLTVFTGACGPLIYRGDAFPPEFHGNAFICEPTGLLLKRYLVLDDERGRPWAKPAYDQREFLTSQDERFRPVNLYDGPDGQLYVVDFSRGLIQHRIFLTTFLRTQILDRGLDAPIGRGRIWRVAYRGEDLATLPGLDVADASWSELAALLDHPNGFWRSRAQQLIVQEGRGDRDAIEIVRELLDGPLTTTGRVHALWTLEGLDGVRREILERAFEDESEEVRATAMRLAEPWLATGDARWIDALTRMALADSRGTLRHQALLSLGEAGSSGMPGIAAILETDTEDRAWRSAALSSLHGRELDFLSLLMDAPAWRELRPGRDVFFELSARAIVRAASAEDVERTIERAFTPTHPEWQRAAIVRGMLAERAPGPEGEAGFLHLPRKPACFDDCAQVAGDDEKSNDLLNSLAWPGRSDIDVPIVEPLSDEQRALFERGARTYAMICAACHMESGFGQAGKAPRLRRSPWVLGSRERLIRIVLHGLHGPLEMDGERWNAEMPAYSASDEELASVLTYIRREWGHTAEPIEPELVGSVRAATRTRSGPYTIEELEQDAGAQGGE